MLIKKRRWYSPGENRFNVPKPTWNRWSPAARRAFNAVFRTLLDDGFVRDRARHAARLAAQAINGG